MRIEIGQDVYSSDNKKVGTVQRFVLDPESREIDSVVIRHGFPHESEVLVDRSMLTEEGNEGIVLSLTQDEVKHLPPFITSAYIEATAEDVRASTNEDVAMDETASIFPVVSGTAAGSFLIPGGASGATQGVAEPDEFPLQPGETMPLKHSDLPSSDVMVSRGTDVFSADGKKLGEVDEVLADDQGQLSGVVIRSGFIIHHQQQIPIDWIDEIGEKDIRLKLSADEAAARANAPGQHGDTATPSA